MKAVSFLRKPLNYTFYNAAVAIIVVNVILFVASYLSPEVFREFALTPFLVVRRTAVWQIITYMFVHGSFWHIFLNMFALFLFGSTLERRLGSSEFLLYYFATGVGAGLFTLLVHWYTGLAFVPIVGASGAIYGLLLAYATYFPSARILMFGILPLRAPMAVLLFAALSLFSQITGAGSGIAHLAHLAAFGFGYVYFLVRFGVNPIRVFFR